jgi:hypothetical protein
MNPPDEKATGLPGFKSWRAVYIFVIVAFITWVGLLVALTVTFS